MEKGRRDSKRSSPTFLHDATSSRCFDSFRGMFYPAKADVPLVDKRVLFDDIPESNEPNGVRQICDAGESLSATKKLFQVGSQHRTREGKSWALAFEDGNYSGRRDSKLSSSFSVYAENKDGSSPAKRRDFERDIAAFESAARAVSNRVNKESNFNMALAKYHVKQENLSDKPAEKKRKEDALEDDHTSNGTRERESYWERRKKNNASAKRSRDARKARELETQIKAAFLERENLRILAQLMIVQQENACLKRVLCAKI